MSISTATIAQLVTAKDAVLKVSQMLQEYKQGHAAPAIGPGRFPIADVDAAITAAKTALTVLVA